MKAWYESMIANVPGMIYRVQHLVDETIQYIYVSEGCRSLFGVGPDQFLFKGLTVRSLVHPGDRQSYDRVAELMTKHSQPWKWEGRFILPSGEEKVIQYQGNPIPMANGAVLWDGMLMDVTDRRRSEQQAALLEAIVEGSHDAIKGKTLEGIVTSWNPAAELMYGYTASEMIGQSITRLLPPDRPHEMDELLERIGRGERVDSYETVRRAKDGTLLDVALTMSPIRDNAGCVTGASTIAQNITERKRAERELAAAAAKNKRIAEALQRSMLQASLSDRFLGIEVKTLYEAALREADVGGDFFDAFVLADGKVALVVGDVSGKGLIAAGRTAEVKYALRALLHEYLAPEIALAHLNNFICDTHRLDTDNEEAFIILALAVMDTVTGQIAFSTAGAEPTLILRKTGHVEQINITGLPLGIVPNAVYQLKEDILGFGETVLMATDGLTEARREYAFLGVDGLAALAEKTGPTTSLRELSLAIYEGARDFASGELHDDICLLAARRQ